MKFVYYLLLFLFWRIIAADSFKNATKLLPLYYISTNEGLLSHFRQLEIVWNAVLRFNRPLIAVGFYSQHYHNVVPITLCDVFLLPPLITCSKEDNATIIKRKHCEFTGAMFSPEKYYRVPMLINANFSYESVECVAGAVNMQIGYPTLSHREIMLSYPIFTSKYYSLLPLIRQILKIGDEVEYAVAHWRRGDQLNKCPHKSSLHHTHDNNAKKARDNSINCGNSSEFLTGFAADMMHHIPATSLPMMAYVSTNEQDPIILKHLKSTGIMMFADISAGLKSRGYHLDLLDEFVVELMMMCLDTAYLFAWGDSSSHNFFKHCRALHTMKKRVTIIDSIAYVNNSAI